MNLSIIFFDFLKTFPKIYGALHCCISKMPRDQLRRVVHIAVCGQMHGVMFWRQGDLDQTRLYCHHQLFSFANGLKTHLK